MIIWYFELRFYECCHSCFISILTFITGKKEDRKNATEEDGSSQEDEVKKLEDMSIDAPVEG